MIAAPRRQIGAIGTVARALVGVVAVVAAVALGIDAAEAALGLVAIPAVVTAALRLRGAGAPPLRLHAQAAHLANIAVGVALVSWQPEAAMLFYGASMLLAAWRGIGACELFAVPNLLLRRDDQLGCPVFLPVDLVDARLTDRELYCS